MSLIVVALCAACGAGTEDLNSEQALEQVEVATIAETPTVVERRPGVPNGDGTSTIRGLQEAILAAEQEASISPPEAAPIVDVPDLGEANSETPVAALVPGTVDNVDPGTAAPSEEPDVIERPAVNVTPDVADSPAVVETPDVTITPDTVTQPEPAPVVTPDMDTLSGTFEGEAAVEPVQTVTAGTDEDTETAPVEGVVAGSDEIREPAPAIDVVTTGSDEDKNPEPSLFMSGDTDESASQEPVVEAQEPVVEAQEPVVEAQPTIEPEPVVEVAPIVEAEPVTETPVAEAPVTEAPVTEEPAVGAAEPDPAPVDADGDGVTDSDIEEEIAVEVDPDPIVVEEEPPFEETVAVVDQPAEETPVDLDEIFDSMNTEENVSMTFSDIAAGGLDNACYLDTDHYVAEFLYQNPEVCFWEADDRTQSVRALPTPVVPDNAVRLPAPSGGDDTAALERVINANRGGAVVGQGVYKVNRLDINVKVDIFDMPMKTTRGADVIVRINAPDVRIFNSPIDGEGSNTAHIGFSVEHGSHRFVLVNSGFSNVLHKQSNSAAGVFIRGVDDFHIACNTFDNIINDTSNKTKTARANAVWMNGANTHNTSGGIIANNRSTELQSNGKIKDAEFFTTQGYVRTDKNRPVRIFANRGLNAGKRMTKHQEDDAVVLSNHYYWRDKPGPLGDRLQFAMVNVQFSDNIIARNNRFKVAADSRFDSIFHANGKWKGVIQDNLHFDCNDIEVVDRIAASSNTVSIIIQARNNSESRDSTAFEATNSTANYNVVRGTGSVKFYYAFAEGYSNDGGRFETKGNVFNIPWVQAKYKYKPK